MKKLMTAIFAVLFFLLLSTMLFAQEQAIDAQQIHIDPALRQIYTAIGLDWLLPPEPAAGTLTAAAASQESSAEQRTEPASAVQNNPASLASEAEIPVRAGRVSITGTEPMFARKQSGTDFFGPSDGRDFFDNPKQPQAPKVPNDINGTTAGASDSGDENYRWAATVKMDATNNLLLDNYGGAPLFMAAFDWAPVSHLGIGFNLGIMVSEYIPAVYGPGGYGWDAYFSEMLVVADDSDHSETYAFYRMKNGNEYLFKTGVELNYLLQDAGLKGTYVGMEAGMMITPAMLLEAYLTENHQNPIQHINEDGNFASEGILPVLNYRSFYVSPTAGYRLIFRGIALDIRFGWQFSTFTMPDGLNSNISIGYSF